MGAKTPFRGSFTALVTPFKNGSLDEKAFRGLVDWQIAEGTNGLVPVGTTGESPTLSAAEQRRVVVLRFVEEKSIKEVAREIRKTEGAVKQLQFRALTTLRTRMEGADA